MRQLTHRFPSPVSQRRDGLRLTETCLGFDHPLCSAERELRAARRQLLGTAVFLGAFSAFARAQAIGPVIGIGAVALALVWLHMVMLAVTRRDRTLEAI